MSWLLEGHWPWWLSALALAAVALLMWTVERRMLGVSGSFARVVRRDDPDDAAARDALADDPHALDEALIAATREEFGDEAADELVAEMRAAAKTRADAAETPAADEEGAALIPYPGRLPRSVHFVFLSCMVVGGAIAMALSSGWSVSWTLGETYSELIGDGVVMLAACLGGGVLTGIGTRMAGGCTSGHGLTGCARVQPGSLVATAIFFGTAIAVSFLLDLS